MLKCYAGRGESAPAGRSFESVPVRRGMTRARIAAAAAGLVLLAQPACLFRKHKTAAPPPPPASVRIVYLPLNIPSENTSLRWLSLAVPIMMAKVSEQAQDIQAVPLWEAMPVAIEAAGNSRSITPEIAAYVASRLTAKWATEGDLSPTKGGVRVLMDFIPARTTLVPFRYEKETSIDSLGAHLSDALAQLLRYLVLRPMPRTEDSKPIEADSLKDVAAALDREYGWYVAAEPGKSDKIVEELARSDNRLARLLFNPNLYPGIGTPPPESKTDKPASSTAVQKGSKSPSSVSQPQSPPAAPGWSLRYKR